jgi:hypothetical protein
MKRSNRVTVNSLGSHTGREHDDSKILRRIDVLISVSHLQLLMLAVEGD